MLWARVVNNQIVQIIDSPRPGDKIEFDRLVNITGRPDLKVGSTWPFKTVAQAIADGELEHAPTDSDPHALKATKGGA